MTARDWADTVIWWQVFPLGFAGAPAEGLPEAGDGDVADGLPGEGWLDHLVDLGCNGLALGPVFAAQSHGYDTLDHHAVDRRLGDTQTLRTLLDRCRARGVRVLLDGVFNHLGRDHPIARRAIEAGPDSEPGRWLRWTAGPAGWPEPEVFEGHSRLVVLNHDNPQVADLVVDVLDHWLDAGADGWRLDAAYAVPAPFWAQVLPRVRERHPDAWFVGEVIHGDYAGYVEASGLDAVTQYELWKAVWSSLRERNFFELDWTLRRHAELLTSFVPLTFLGNHDVTRIASQLGDRRLLPHAVALLCLLPGVPSVYYGDEFGLEAVKEERLGGDDAIRPAFPDDPAELEERPGGGVEDLYRMLIAVRRRHPWLVDAELRTEDLSNEQVAVVLTARAGAEHGRLALLLNVGEKSAELVPGDGDWTVVERSPGDPGRGPSVVGAHGWSVLAG
ncbi:glycosidase [Friedmanniella endophytica]|uniref:Glycosidase n=1 Tax=Microlunatus kandeliicorticis TaxID=1759536 RepID=A0A7W3P685_9ACTN|nr:alpha-amylase family protein [Microlunatus kandeliicorticis]MBA8794655.1 glycosidase [Microlunatus kandeliicorticis]